MPRVRTIRDGSLQEPLAVFWAGCSWEAYCPIPVLRRCMRSKQALFIIHRRRVIGNPVDPIGMTTMEYGGGRESGYATNRAKVRIDSGLA